MRDLPLVSWGRPMRQEGARRQDRLVHRQLYCDLDTPHTILMTEREPVSDTLPLT
jgi:hypothetical protein